MPETVRLLPQDAFNDNLVANVRPSDWTNPRPASRYDLIVIGAGTAGLVTAAGAAGLGAKVALVERHLMGGDCLNVGCVPSKALLRSARALADARDAREFGVDGGIHPTVRFRAVMERMRQLRADISPHDSARRFTHLGVDVFFGQAQFTGGDTVGVDGTTLRFRKAVIATGTRPAVPPIQGLAEAGFLTNETIFSLTELPQRLAILGAGPVGCELAQAFTRFGAEVYLIGNHARILPREDGDAVQIIEMAVLREHVRISTSSATRRVESQGKEKVLFLQGSTRSEEIRVDHILVAVGRTPNVEGLGLETAGVAYDPRHGVHVNDRLQTTNRRIYAAGDICSRFKFTHAADAQARIVIRNALFAGRARASSLVMPWCTYTDPEIAHVGLYEREAQEQGIPVQTFVQPFADVDRAILDGETAGFVKVHVRKGTDKILGATIVARHAGEMISELTLAMVGGLGLKTIADTIHPYPTQAEAIKKVADAYSRTRLTPWVKWLLAKWLRWAPF